MKYSSKISSALYRVINKPEVKNEISGAIYKGYVPLKSQLEDIEINILTNPNEYVTNGYANINIYCIEDDEGRANTKRLDQISKLVVPLIKDTKHSGIYFQLEGQSGILRDRNRDKMSFYNLKINFQTL